jgi:uncharacterized membrane protein
MTNLFGLPAHPLLVHAVVVLVPLLAIGAMVAVFRPSFRARVGGLLAAGAVLNLVLTPLTVISGERLEERIRETAALETHADQGQSLLPWVAVLAAALVLYIALDRWRARKRSADGGQPGSRLAVRLIPLVLASLVVVTAAGSAVTIVVIGHSGAQATWSQLPASGGDG